MANIKQPFPLPPDPSAPPQEVVLQFGEFFVRVREESGCVSVALLQRDGMPIGVLIANGVAGLADPTTGDIQHILSRDDDGRVVATRRAPDGAITHTELDPPPAPIYPPPSKN